MFLTSQIFSLENTTGRGEGRNYCNYFVLNKCLPFLLNTEIENIFEGTFILRLAL